MSDAALAVAQIVAPPRAQQSAADDSSGEAASSDSSFGAMVQSRIDAQNTDAAQSSSQKSANDTATANDTASARDAKSSADKASGADAHDKVSANDNEASSKKPGKSQADAKPEKAGKSQPAQDAADAEADAAALSAAQALAAAQPQAKDTAIATTLPVETIAGAGAGKQVDNTKNTAATAEAMNAEGSAPPATPANAAAPAPTDAAAAIAADNAAFAQLMPAGAALSAPSPKVNPKTNSEQTNSAAGIKGPEPVGAGLKSEANKAPSLQTPLNAETAVANDKGGKNQAGIPSPEQQMAATAVEQAVPSTSSAEDVKSAAPTKPVSKDTSKKGNPDQATTAANTNSPAGGLTIASAQGSETAASTGNETANPKIERKATPTVAPGTPDSAKTADAKTPAAILPNGEPKAATSLGTFEAKAKEAVAQQSSSTPTPATPQAASSSADAKPSTQATPQNAPAQPAVPSSAQPQNQTLIVANIVQPASSNSNPVPTIQAQMDGPRLTLPADQIAVEIRRHQAAGADHFNIKIDPPELGRIDVKIEMTSDGQTKAHLTADRQDTLDLLQRDSKVLERALNSNGLKTDRDSLNFSLRQDNPSNRDGGWSNSGSQGRSPTPNGYYGSEDEIIDMAPIPVRFVDPTRVDILI